MPPNFFSFEGMTSSADFRAASASAMAAAAAASASAF